MKRSGRLQPKSAKAIAAEPEIDAARAALYARDGMVCRLAGVLTGVPCFGRRATPHHLRKPGRSWALDNLVVLCARHNEWVEDEPNAAHALGLVVRRGETVDDAWRRLAAAGLGRSTDPTQQPKEQPE